MDIRPIRTDTDYRSALKEVETIMTAESRTAEGDKLDILGSTINQNLLCRLLLAVLFMLSAARLLVILGNRIIGSAVAISVGSCLDADPPGQCALDVDREGRCQHGQGIIGIP